MKILSKTDFSVSFFKAALAPKAFLCKGDVLTVDAHSISYNLSTPFFLRN
jgi:hypothetical protein